MQVTYTWNFWNFNAYPEKDGYTDVVFQVSYNYIGTSDVPSPRGGFYTASWSDVQSLQYEAGTPFIPFDELTPDIVQGWMEATITPEQFAKMQANIVGNIDAQIHPPVVSLTPPWTPAPVPPSVVPDVSSVSPTN